MLKVLIDVLMMNVCYYSGWVFVGMTYGDVKHMWHVLQLCILNAYNRIRSHYRILKQNEKINCELKNVVKQVANKDKISFP